MYTTTLMLIFAAAWLSLNVHAQCPQIRGLGQANFIIKNNPSAAQFNLLLNNNFEKIPSS